MGVRTGILLGLEALRRVLRLCGRGDVEGDDHDHPAGYQDENGHEEVPGEVDMDDTVPEGEVSKQKLGQVVFSPSLIPSKERLSSLGNHFFPLQGVKGSLEGRD